jgi:ubiquinone/menaquinone biosynthesis C-methylase UbiE
MDRAEFDAIAADYRQQHAASIRLSGEGPDYFAEYKIADVAGGLADIGIAPSEILDFGCGIGESLPFLHRHFPAARLSGVDVSGDSLALAAERYGTMASLTRYDGERLPFADASFDLVFTACVFHHIPPADHARLLKEIHRVLRPSGHFFLFEHNPWNPATRHAVANCPFDANAILISAPDMKQRMAEAGFPAVRYRYRLFFPHLLRWLRPLERQLTWLPLGAQYFCWSRGAA